MHQMILNAYKRELQYLREVGAEFAKAHPRIGSALSLDNGQSSDPMVERLLEGLAFLSARTAHRIDTEHGRLKQDLLQSLMPDLLLPLPITTLVEFKPMPTLPAGTNQFVKKGSQLRYLGKDKSDINFYCNSDVAIAPLKISILESPSRVSQTRFIQQSVELGLTKGIQSSYVLRAELSTLGSQSLASCLPKKLRMLCSGNNSLDVWNVLTSKAKALLLIDPSEGGFLYGAHSLPCLEPVGYDESESLIPAECMLPGPLRLLREWRHYPDRFNFAELIDLQKSLRGYRGQQIELWWFYDDAPLSVDMAPDALRLHCSPVVNLYKTACEPIVLHETVSEYCVKLPAHQATNSDIVSLSQVDYKDSLGNWHELSSFNQGFDESSNYRYALRSEPRWRKNNATKKIELSWEWKIAPTVVPGIGVGEVREMLSINAWSSQPNAVGIFSQNDRDWRLDASAPILRIHDAGYTVPQSSVPIAKDLLPGAMGLRLDLLQGLAPSELAKRLREWLGIFELSEYSAGIEQATISLEVRRVPKIATLLHARGWVVRMGLDENLATHPRLQQWLRVLTKTMSKQLQSESFVECCFEYQNKPLGVSSVWQ